MKDEEDNEGPIEVFCIYRLALKPDAGRVARTSTPTTSKAPAAIAAVTVGDGRSMPIFANKYLIFFPLSHAQFGQLTQG